MVAKRQLAAYQEALGIDCDSLDECLIEQPRLYEDCADEAALATSRAAALDLDLEERMAELDKEIRRDLALREEKSTEPMIKNLITTHKDIRKLHRDLLAAQLEADRWKALGRSMHERAQSLRDLVSREIHALSALSVEKGSAVSRAALRDSVVADYERRLALEQEATLARAQRRRSRND